MRRVLSALLGLFAIAGLLLAGTHASAAQAPKIEFKTVSAAAGQDASAEVYIDGVLVGRGRFNDNPSGSTPGDAINACDFAADSWGIETELYVDPDKNGWGRDRWVNTRGQNSPYCSDWKGGNLAEDTEVAIRICMVRGTETLLCSGFAWGRS